MRTLPEISSHLTANTKHLLHEVKKTFVVYKSYEENKVSKEKQTYGR
jgi:hypothetical protein